MEPYLDISDVIAVKALSCTFPLVGIATNPSTIAADKKSLEAMFPQPRETMGGQGRLFAQVMATTAEGMVNDACKLRSIITDIVVKVPVIAEGLIAIKILKVEEVPTLGTAVYGAAQELLSAPVGAEYVAPYVNRIDAQDGSGTQTATDLYQPLKMHMPQTKVLAVSFKTPRQALDCLLVGGGSIILPLDVVQQMISYPIVDAAVAKFERDW